MTSSIPPLENPQRTVWLYSDGSASTHQQRTGAHAALVLWPDGTHDLVVGTCNQTKINRMELTALNAALYYVSAIHEKGGSLDLNVRIITDSQVTEMGAVGRRGPANGDLWAAFDVLATYFNGVTVTHMSRNEEPAQAMADACCHLFRTAFEDLLGRTINHPAFSTLGIRRKTQP